MTVTLDIAILWLHSYLKANHNFSFYQLSWEWSQYLMEYVRKTDSLGSQCCLLC